MKIFIITCLLRSFVRLLYYDNIYLAYYLLASFVRSHEGNINNNAQTLVSTVQPFKFWKTSSFPRTSTRMKVQLSSEQDITVILDSLQTTVNDVCAHVHMFGTRSSVGTHFLLADKPFSSWPPHERCLSSEDNLVLLSIFEGFLHIIALVCIPFSAFLHYSNGSQPAWCKTPRTRTSKSRTWAFQSRINIRPLWRCPLEVNNIALRSTPGCPGQINDLKSTHCQSETYFQWWPLEQVRSEFTDSEFQDLSWNKQEPSSITCNVLRPLAMIFRSRSSIRCAFKLCFGEAVQ